MDPKQKMIFAAVAGVCGLAIAALAVLLFMQIGAMNEAREARDSAESELSSYYSETPYPSKVNREIRVKDAETYAAVSTAARNLLAATLAYPQGESPSQFVTRVVDTIHVLDGRKNASRVELIDSMAKGKTSTAANEAVMDYSCMFWYHQHRPHDGQTCLRQRRDHLGQGKNHLCVRLLRVRSRTLAGLLPGLRRVEHLCGGRGRGRTKRGVSRKAYVCYQQRLRGRGRLQRAFPARFYPH